MTKHERAETTRLESLWAGPFGDAYVERNAVLDSRRATFWGRLLADASVQSVLEVGCGQGANLGPIASILDPSQVWGIDINRAAIERARVNAPGVNAVASVARRLPFRDDFVDLVFTIGVLIHQPETTLPVVLSEIVRCARRFVLWGEYHAPERQEVPYRGESAALFRRDYGRIYRELFPELIVRSEGFLSPEEGFDRVTWQLLEKP